MKTLADYHTDFVSLAEVDFVRRFAFHEPEMPGIYEWLLKEAINDMPQDDRKRVDAAKSSLVHLKQGKAVKYDYCAEYRKADVRVGRLYGGGSQNLWSPFSAAIYKRVESADVDIVNCHPVLLSQFCAKLGIPCPCLDRYVMSREEVLKIVREECGVSREAGKDLFRRALYLGSDRQWMKDHETNVCPPFFQEFSDEVYRIVDLLVGRYPADMFKLIQTGSKKKSSSQRDARARFISMILSDIENQCVCAAVHHAIERLQKTVYVLKFDGFVVNSASDEELSDLSRVVREKTGFDLQFVIKPFSQAYDIPPNICELNDMILYDTVEHIYNSHKSRFDDIKFDGMSGQYYSFESGVWKESCDGIVKATFYRLLRSTCDSMPNVHRLWMDKDKIFNMLIALFCTETRFADKLDLSMTIFPFANGCWDFKTSQFRELQREDLVSKTSGWNYEPGQDQAWIRKFNEKVFPIVEEREAVRVFCAYVFNPVKNRKKDGVLHRCH